MVLELQNFNESCKSLLEYFDISYFSCWILLIYCFDSKSLPLCLFCSPNMDKCPLCHVCCPHKHCLYSIKSYFSCSKHMENAERVGKPIVVQGLHLASFWWYSRLIPLDPNLLVNEEMLNLPSYYRYSRDRTPTIQILVKFWNLESMVLR